MGGKCLWRGLGFSKKWGCGFPHRMVYCRQRGTELDQEREKKHTRGSLIKVPREKASPVIPGSGQDVQQGGASLEGGQRDLVMVDGMSREVAMCCSGLQGVAYDQVVDRVSGDGLQVLSMIRLVRLFEKLIMFWQCMGGKICSEPGVWLKGCGMVWYGMYCQCIED